MNNPSPSSAADLLAAVARLAEAASALPADAAAGFRVALRCGSLSLTVGPAVPRQTDGDEDPAPIPPPPCVPAPRAVHGARMKVRRVHKRIWEAASAADPTPSKVLIPRAGYRFNTYTQDAITELCRHGYLIRLPDGLVRGRQLPGVKPVEDGRRPAG